MKEIKNSLSKASFELHIFAKCKQLIPVKTLCEEVTRAVVVIFPVLLFRYAYENSSTRMLA